MRFFEEATIEVMAFEIEDVTTSAVETTAENAMEEDEF